MRSLNLASRPFRNERLPNLLTLVGLGIALTATAYHVFLVRDVMPDRTSALTLKLQEMEAESARLRAEAKGLQVERPDPGTLAQWTRLKDLVDRRLFSWSGLFAVLEDSLPNGVRLINVAPNLHKGQITLHLTAVARSVDEALEFMSALEARPEFANVWPTSRGSGQEGFDYQYEMTYLPQPRQVAASPAPSPAPASSVETVPAAAVASAAAGGAR